MMQFNYHDMAITVGENHIEIHSGNIGIKIPTRNVLTEAKAKIIADNLRYPYDYLKEPCLDKIMVI